MQQPLPSRAESLPSDEAPVKPAEASRRRYRRVLPPSLFLLVLVVVLFIFHGILLPFVLALFFAYLVYPIVRLLNRIHVSRLRVPRWTAVLITYFLVGFGLYRFVPLTVSGIGDEFANLFKEIPSIFNGLRDQRQALYQSIEDKFRVAKLPEAQRRAIDQEFAQLWKDAHPLPRKDETRDAPEKAHGDEPPKPDVPEWSLAFTAFKQQFDEYLDEVVDAPDTYDRIVAGNTDAKNALPVGQLKDLRQQVKAAIREYRDWLGEKFFAELEQQVDERFDSAAEQSRAAVEQAGSGAANRPQSIHEKLVALYQQHESDLGNDHIAQEQVDRLARQIKDNLVIAFSREKLARDIRDKMDDYLKGAQESLIGYLERISGYVPSIIRGIFTFFVILMIAAFFIVFFPKIKDYGRDLFPPEYHEDYESILQKIDARLSGVIRGQFIICLVNGSLTYFGLWMLGLPLAPTLATIAGVLSLVPIFGTILSTIPAVVVALSVSSDHQTGGVLAQHIAQSRILLALAVIGWVCIIHAIESYILNPNIMGQTAHMNPLIIVFALLAGEHVGGIIGALLAVPIASIFVTLFAYLHRKTVESLQSGSISVPPGASTG